MKNKILVGSIIAVAIIALSSFSSVVSKVASDEKVVGLNVIKETDTPPIELVFQLLNKHRYNKEIQRLDINIDSIDDLQDEVLQIIKNDEKLNSIVEQLSDTDDCGCNDGTGLIWPFPVFCSIFVTIFIVIILTFYGPYAWGGPILEKIAERMFIFGEKFCPDYFN